MQQVKKTRPARGAADFAQIGLAGFLMGICEIIPGVSGGTMAFILGIYEELIQSIRDVSEPEFIKAVTGFKIKRIFEILNWQFLGTLFVGMLVAIVALAEVVGRLLETKPAMIWSFFFGLVLASIILIGRRIAQWTPLLIGILVAVAVSVFFIFGGSGITTPDTWWAFILSGAVAICAFILPGISGSFVLVLLGKYDQVLDAVRGLDIVTVGLVGVGAVLGLITFARVVGWLFENYHDIVVAALSGLMVGSLRVIWPWKINPACLDQHVPCTNALPVFNSSLLLAIGLMVAGVVTILAIERFSNAAK
ncbi:MAG TPA: DUF368 domain-containing protein [Anaerolineae bacterium]|nr:DUF368 domain-containing protein [Anaerolineae bacterium]